TPTAGIILLDPTSAGALSISGSGQVNDAASPIIVDSNSAQAVLVGGTGSAVASAFEITGGDVISGQGTLQGTAQTGQAAIPDPLASLAPPPIPSQTFAAVNLRGKGSFTLQPGDYVGGIHLAGSVQVTLLPGIYYLQGGGLSVSGKATLTGNG